jgi:hypothetical protein
VGCTGDPCVSHHFSIIGLVGFALRRHHSFSIAYDMSSQTADSGCFSDIITPSDVTALLRDELSSSCNVQVIGVEEGSTPSGHTKYTLTISDSVHCCDCIVVPNLWHLLSCKLGAMFTIVSINQVLVTETSCSLKHAVMDMVPVTHCCNVIGAPKYLWSVIKRNLSPSSSHREPPNKLICASDIWKAFQDGHYNDCSNETVDVSDAAAVCGWCNSNPCDWVKYGGEIISYLDARYVGCFTYDNGNIVDEILDTCAPITNHQLQYLAYAAFTSVKHGYLGKKKQIPLANCVLNGIWDVYPDVDHLYVGFKHVENNEN